ERKARSSLRFLLHVLKRQAPAEGLEIEPARLRWYVDTDLLGFLDRETDVGSRVEQYGGPLLDGFRLRGAPEFESWLDIERQRVHGEFVSLVDRLSESLTTSGRVDEALEVLDRVLGTDPLAERTFTRKLRLLVDHGRTDEAEAEYRDFAHRLRQEFGLEPAEATRRLVSQPATAVAVTRTASRRAHTVPAAIDPLVGRHREKGEVKALLTDPACRLLTLLAAGGMGKSRLALEVAREL